MIVRRLLAAALVVLTGAGRVDAAALVDPNLRFRQLTSRHFIIYYHQGVERLARRLAVIAEETREALARSLRVPSGRTHVVLADQSELANGWATPLPYNTMLINPAWPAGSDLTGHVDDWLRVVFAHEFTHIVHLDRSGHWAGVARRIFGRLPLAFPSMFRPVWEVEGIASFYESRLTGVGRLHAADFTAIVGQAARRGVLEPLDRVSGGLTDWPGPQAPYAYGIAFHEYLADRFGEPGFDALASASARSIPYIGARAFKTAFDVPLDVLWADFTASLEASADRPDDSVRTSAATRLTFTGFMTTAPRFLPAGCAACPEEIAYTSVTPHDFPSVRLVGADGERGRVLATRYLGSTLGATPTTIVFDQLELRRNAGLYSDLYALDRATGRIQALTREARLLDPDVAPDGRTIVAVHQDAEQRSLVRLELTRTGDGGFAAGRARSILREPDTQFNAPRWSPDGRTIVAERHRLAALPEIVLIDPCSSAVHVVAAAAGRRFVTPAWRPDGRAIVAAADLNGTFNLYELPVNGGIPRQLTFLDAGAYWPDVSSDGRTLVFAGYTTDGFDVFTMAYPRDAAEPLRELPSRGSDGPPGPPCTPTGQTARLVPRAVPDDFVAADLQPGDVLSERRDAIYSPWPTLRPTYWAPIVTLDGDQLRAGALTSGFDVLRYHAFSARTTWLVHSSGADPSPRPTAPDWDLSYVYNRWRPAFFASTSQTTTLVNAPALSEAEGPVLSAVEGPADAFDIPPRGSLREHAIEGGVAVPILTARRSQQWRFLLRREALRHAVGDRREAAVQHAIRAGWMLRSAREYGYSIGPEDGMELGATLDWRPDVRGEPVTTLTVDGRAYLPGARQHHVTAVRAGLGVSLAPLDRRRRFLLGGAQASAAALAFDRDALGLLRGFGENAVDGSRLAVVNAEYRWPIARPQRGIRTWPLLVHSVHAAMFGDAAYAWDRGLRARGVRTALGGELSLDLVAGYRLPVTLAIGAAWTRDGAQGGAHGAALFGRIGRSF